MTGTGDQSPVDAAREEVLAQRQVLENWTVKQARAESALAGLLERAGAEILDNPEAAEDVDDELGRLRARVRVAERAIEAQRPRVTVAESRYLAAEAAVLEARAVEAQQALEGHQAQTRRLLGALERHEGKYLPEMTMIRAQMSAGAMPTGSSWRLPKSDWLRKELFIAQLQAAVVRAMAGGEDPAELVREASLHRPHFFGDDETIPAYPDCVQGPEALVPTRQFAASVAALGKRVADLEELQRRLPEEIEQWVERGTHGDPAFPTSGLETRRRRLETVGVDLEQARAALASLTNS